MKSKDMSWGKYIKTGLGRRLSVLGEHLGMDWLIYNPLHFEHFHDNAMANASKVIDVLTSHFPEAKRWVDIGAGTGAFAAELHRRKLEVVACEHNAYGRKRAIQQGVDARPFDLRNAPPAILDGTFDVAYCFEVAEHLPQPVGEALVAYIASLAPIAVFTAAHPGQGGTGHINEQRKEYWIEQFSRHGMKFDEATSNSVREGFKQAAVPGAWFKDNIIICRRQP